MASHSQGTGRYRLRSSFSSEKTAVPTDMPSYAGNEDEKMNPATRSITNKKTSAKRQRHRDDGQEDEYSDADLQPQSQAQGQDQGHVVKRPRLTSMTTTTTTTKRMIVEVPEKAPEGVKKDRSYSTQNNDKNPVGEEDALSDKDDMGDHSETDEESIDFQVIADGPGVRRRLFPEHAPTPGRSYGLDFADIVKQEQESPTGISAGVLTSHGSAGKETTDSRQAQLDEGSNEHHDPQAGSRADVRDEMTLQPPASDPNDTALASSTRFTITPTQRAQYFAERAAHEDGIPNMPDFIRDLRFEMRRATVDFAIALELPDSFKIASTQLVGRLPEKLLNLFVILDRGFDGPKPGDDDNSSIDDADGTKTQRSATGSMLEVPKPQNQALYTGTELMEALLGAAITDWVLKKDPFNGHVWKQATGWATQSVLWDQFSEEAAELVWQELHVRILDKQLKKKKRFKKAARMAEEFAAFITKLGIRHMGLSQIIGGIPVSSEEESSEGSQTSEDEDRLDALEEFLNDLKWIFDSAIKMRL